MGNKLLRLGKKIAKIIGITIASILLLLFLLPYILPNTISRKIKAVVNRSIDGEVSFSKARLSFFNHFPALTLTLHNFTMKGSTPFKKDTLLSADEVAFGIDIPAMISGNLKIDKFFLTDADVHVIVNQKGDANYNVFKSSGGIDSSSTSSGDTSTSLKIEKIIIEHSHVLYDDSSAGILINADGVDYTGKGDLSKAIFDLTSHLTIDSLDLYLEREPYILKKRINANLLTSINTNSLALKFEKNKLRINQLPLDFTGKFDFLPRGYFMDFRIKSRDAGLSDLLSVLPPSYQGWLKKTKVSGDANVIASLTGNYLSGGDTMPDLSLSMKVRDGFISYESAPAPVSNLYLDFETRFPGFNPDSLSVNIDSLYFNMEKDHFSSAIKIKGLFSPFIVARANASMDLETLDKAIGLSDVDFRGKLELEFSANGLFATGDDPDKLRSKKVITSIPSFKLRTSLKQGYFHLTRLPQAIPRINFVVQAHCPDHDYHHTSASIDDINVSVLENYIKGFIRLKNADDMPVDAQLDANIKLSEIKQFFPSDSLDLNGSLVMNIRSTGNYQPARNLFPRTTATLKIENASLRTSYYPTPIDKIQVDAVIENKEGTLYDLDVAIKPISFEFEGKPFIVKADLSNFKNLRYDISSQGEVDLGRIYKVFSQQGLDVKGIIKTNLSLKGSQADAIAGRYSRLNNRGTMELDDLRVTSDLYPLPFFIKKGLFRFQQDQVSFENFSTSYGRSSVVLSGNVSNIFDYIAGQGPLRGELSLQSPYVLLDELMAYHSDSISVRHDSVSKGSSGVIMIPADLDIAITADIKSVDYNKLNIKDVKGNVALNGGQLTITKTGFTLADAMTSMDATYKSLSPARAYFTYHVVVNDFDIKKMYNQVELFRQLAPAAGKAEGIISLDYNLEGKLNSEMYPVMPSLKGGGVLSIKNVKMKGFKMFSAMGKETGKDGLNDPDLSKINFKTSIKNNIVTLERTKIKVAGFRLRMQGQTDFNGRLNFKCRIGLPPFGIVGIPLKITGTGDNPKIKTGKKEELPLQEQQKELDDKDN